MRETSAQTLGMVIKHLDRCGVEGMVNVLLQLLAQQQWEVRHGGLLGFKYLLAVRQVRYEYWKLKQKEKKSKL